MATLFPDVPAFANLRDVRPGMSIGSLWTMRRPRIAPYLGFSEVSAGDTIEYMVNGALDNDQGRGQFLFLAEKILTNESVVGIAAWERIADDDSANAKWASRVGALATRATRPPVCFTIPRAGLTRVALVQRSDAWLGVQLINRRQLRSVQGTYVEPPTLIAFATTQLDRYVPAKFARKPIECPSATGAASVEGVSQLSSRASSR